MMYANGEVTEVRTGYSKRGVAWARVTLLCGTKQTSITCVAFESDAEIVMKEVEEGMQVQLTLDPYWRKDETSRSWELQLKVLDVKVLEGVNGVGREHKKKQPQRAQPQRSQMQRGSRKRRDEEEEEEAPF